MKVRVLRDGLVAGLDTVTKAAKLKSVLPVLGMVLLDAYQGQGPKGGVLRLMCTDLNVSLEHRINAQVEEPGGIAVPHRLFHELSIAMLDGQINLETEEETVTLRMANNDGSNRSSIKCLHVSEWPTASREAQASITMPTCGPFLDAVRQVSFAADQQDGSRPVLGGVLVAIAGEQITLVAADGYRLAERKITVPGIGRDGVEEEWSAIVPSRSLAHLLGVVKGVDDPLVIDILSNDGLAFTCGPIRMATNAVEGKHFNWEGIIPASSTLVASFDVKAMCQAVRSMAVFGRAWAKPTVRMTIDPGSQIVIRGEDQERGDGSAVVDAEVEGDGEVPFTMALNANFLDAALKSAGLNYGSARIEATVPTAPVLIRPEGDEHLRHIIMPSVIRSM